tara:strand:+ start:10335 stop:11357 length:1023 start_codon:yes stop_codon:yes gene_type:complete
MRVLVIYNHPCTGLGQTSIKYVELMKSLGHEVICKEFVDYFYDVGEKTRVKNKIELPDADILFVNIAPMHDVLFHINTLTQKYQNNMCMMVWETEEVPEIMIRWANYFKTVLTPSMYCLKIFKRAINKNILFVPHYVPRLRWEPSQIRPKLKTLMNNKKYKFYTIGNMADKRKNLDFLIKGFLECNFKNAMLFIKVQSYDKVDISGKNVYVLDDVLISNEEISYIHDKCDCYISTSFSEGVGLGVVEAANHNNPVIMTDYGGQNDYVDTEYLIDSTIDLIGFNYGYFTSNMTWGHPNYNTYIKHLKEVYGKNVKKVEHQKTMKLAGNPNYISMQFRNLLK